MQTKEQIQYLLQRQYNITRWKAFLSELFTSSNMFSSPTPIAGINTAIATQALHIGSIALLENGISRNIAVYEVTLAQNVVLERNRVGLRNLLKQAWKEQDAAFIVYHKSGDKNWRFSYVSELKKFNEAGEYVANNTEPKRYTYVLGETESCRTASERFYALQQKASNATLDDVKEAFSVEKLSKTFFADYKVHYQDFVQYLTGKRLEKVAGKWEEVKKHDPSPQMTYIFNNDEKDVRDFCKKLLGRIVFLYFIQKKGWLGVPLAGEWGSGKPDFMSRLLANCANPAIFYSEYLSKLFFETLNQKRDNDLAEIVAGEPTKIPYLNGGLFEEDNPKHRDLVFETDLFKKLFDFFDQYNFTIYEDDPNDHTVAVDPEMLGHIFENLLEDNKDKGAFYTPKEIVHYMCQESLIEYLSTWFTAKNYQVTPDNFVSFDNVAQTSFISANEGRSGQGMLEIKHATANLSKVINRSLIEKLLKKQLSDDDKLAVVEHANEFNEALDKVKICDPAIGSGAFPMGLLQEIFTAKQTIHTFVHGDLTTFEPASIKLNIIQNSIYGVDIERGAVDIARLRFWLSLVVDEPAPQALPNLDYKIVVGNSLISKLGDDVIEIDWDIKPNNHGLFGAEEAKNIQTILKQLSSLQRDFFNPSARKKDHATQIRNLKIELLINQLNLMIESRGLKQPPPKTAKLSQKDFVAQTQRYLETQGWLAQISKLQTLKTQPEKTLEFFDWQLNFAEVMNKDVVENGKVGFDIVIGNPPYIRQENFSAIKPYLKAHYKIYHSIADLLTYFVELSYNILANKGSFSFIISNKFTRTNYGQVMRKFLLDTTTLTQLIDFSGIPVFENATVDAAILGFNKIPVTTHSQFNYLSVERSQYHGQALETLFSTQLKPYLQQALTQDVWAFENTAAQAIKAKVEAQGMPLKDWDISISRGILTGFNEAFIVDTATRDRLIAENASSAEVLKPLLRGRDIQKYQAEFAGLWLINLHNGYTKNGIRVPPLDVENFPAIRKHLEPHFFKMKKRTDKGVTPYNLRNCAYIDDFEKPKIVYAEIVRNASFYFDEKGLYPEATSFLISGSNLTYLISQLNSKLFEFVFKKFYAGGGLGSEGFRYKKAFLQEMPIKLLTEAQEQPFKNYVMEISVRKSAGENTQHLEHKIDQLVYKLYNLTLDEVKLIDPEFDLTEAEYAAIALA